ncbi:hypothetical protein G5B37_12105 [Rasiella rasia]|uniref:Uncharacterized protein n=1 Tax=Rasiella rasia TaxID=2744027 RepID=A0A6G6GP17_9FLAO|nr:hypothetical protein [Rasiella rasia]QIE60277.1 hypothetical protein G5B37_12105 [Rasiella rasia]
MKLKITFQVILCITVMCTQLTFGQIGIGTTTPEGILDIESNTEGFVFPRVALSSVLVAAPVVNPAGGTLAVGTTVYNTELTTNGANDVSPGIYSWDGTKWITQHLREDYKRYTQTNVCQRTTIRESTSNPNPNDVDVVAGLDNEVFRPKYSGRYRIEVGVNFSAGEIADFTSQDEISLATSEGSFFFEMSGPGVSIDPTSTSFDYQQGWIYTHSYSTFNSIESPDLEDNTVPHFATVVYYKYLLAGNDYTFSLTNNINTGENYFVNGGDSGTGQGHIGHDQPCSIEFTYLGL